MVIKEWSFKLTLPVDVVEKLIKYKEMAMPNKDMTEEDMIELVMQEGLSTIFNEIDRLVSVERYKNNDHR